MAEYIDREAAKRAVKHIPWCNYSAVGACLDQLPTADVEVVKHGRWIEKEYGTYLPVECDENGDLILHHFVKYICDQCGRVENENEPYCNCGAKMDLEG